MRPSKPNWAPRCAPAGCRMRCCWSGNPAAARALRPAVWRRDYLYPQGGPHAEAVLQGEDTECLTLRGEGASGQIPVKRVREMREAIQHSALSTDAAGRVLFIYGAQDLNGSSANAMLKIIEEPPAGVLFLLTASSAAGVLPTIRSRCAAYTVAPVPRPPRVPPCCAAAACPKPRPPNWPSSMRGISATRCGPSRTPPPRSALAQARDPLRLCRAETIPTAPWPC